MHTATPTGTCTLPHPQVHAHSHTHRTLHFTLSVCQVKLLSLLPAFLQFVEERTRLVNERLARKQELTKQHVRELEEFRTSADPDTISLSSFSAFSDRMSMDRASTRSNRSSKSVSVGTSSV